MDVETIPYLLQFAILFITLFNLLGSIIYAYCLFSKIYSIHRLLQGVRQTQALVHQRV